MEKIMTKDSRMVATTMVFVPALIASVTEVAEIEVRLNANVKMKNFEASFWKPVNRRTKTQHYVCTYVHDKYKFMHGGVFAWTIAIGLDLLECSLHVYISEAIKLFTSVWIQWK